MSPYPLYLNGRFETFEDTFAVTDPATREELGRMSAIGAERLRGALADAHAAFPAWRDMAARDRGDHLLALAGRVAARQEELARTITRENGKPLAQARGEVAMAIDHLRWFAEEGRRAYGRVVPHQTAGKRHLVLRRPIGVVAAIAPWNFPLVLAVRKVAPALAAGCPVILRPASYTPIHAVLLAECVHAAGLPAGVFQVVAGPARELARELFANPVCKKISFTGSTQVGRELVRASAEHLTKLSLELGGNAPVLVFADADLALAVDGAVITKFRNTGQSCIAANRIYVERGIYDAFLERFVAKVKGLRVGNGLDEGVDIGPLIDAHALTNARRLLDDAVGRGARLLCGGQPCNCGAGSFLAPAVLADVPADAACLREEIFAPIAAVCPFDTEEEAIGRANDTEYGLAAYAFTRDLNRAWRLAESLESGTVGINDAVPSTSCCPFGGVGYSGQGRELGSEGLDAFLETRHVSFGGVGG